MNTGSGFADSATMGNVVIVGMLVLDTKGGCAYDGRRILGLSSGVRGF